jgi:hypothetical protein
MLAPYIRVRRLPYEEPYHIQLEFTVSNGVFSGCTDIYGRVDTLTEIGNSLRQFPNKIGDEYRFEYGSEDPSVRFYRCFVMRAYTTSHRGYCNLQFMINQNKAEPNEGVCKFSITNIEPAALNRLGELFVTLSKLQHLELQWTLSDGNVYEHYQDSVNS